MTTRRAMVLVLAGAALVALGCAGTWFRAPVGSVAAGEVTVSGADVAPGAMPLLLVIGAAVIARAMTRGAVRRVLGWLAVACWLALGVTLAFAMVDAEGPLRAAAATATGVPQLAGPSSRSPLPWLALAGSVAGAAGGVLLALARAPAARASRYERTAARAPSRGPDRIEDWDALTRGDDPSAEENQVG